MIASACANVLIDSPSMLRKRCCGVVREPGFQGNGEQIVLQPNRFIAEDPLAHQIWLAADDRSESDVRWDILLQIDTGGNLNGFQAGGREPEYAAFCHAEHRLAG